MRNFLLFIIALSPLLAGAQTLSPKDLRAGDLLFQNLDCGPMCDAIEAVTEGVDGQDFSHVGMVCSAGKRVMIMEAIGKGVDSVSLEDFLKRSHNKVWVGRVKEPYLGLVKDAVAFAKQQTGIPYDGAFLYNNGRYYCSELVYDAFLHASDGKPFFRMYPMTYREPGSTAFFPVWVDYFAKMGMEIPEGLPGCNPGGLSRSDKIAIVGTLP